MRAVIASSTHHQLHPLAGAPRGPHCWRGRCLRYYPDRSEPGAPCTCRRLVELADYILHPPVVKAVDLFLLPLLQLHVTLLVLEQFVVSYGLSSEWNLCVHSAVLDGKGPQPLADFKFR